MIRLGPAGVGGEVLKGLVFIKSKGLTACEIEFTHGVRMSEETAKEVRKLNEKLMLELSVHAPYYINLASLEPEKVKASKKRILDSCERAHQMGAKYVVFHPGFYMGRSKDAVYELIKHELIDLQGKVLKNNWNVFLAPETTGKTSQFGELDDLLRLRKEAGCEICVDFAHLYARYQGEVDYSQICQKLTELPYVHAHFSGIEFTDKGEKRHIVMEKSLFRPLAQEIIKYDLDITIISESPITWQDSLRMVEIFKEII